MMKLVAPRGVMSYMLIMAERKRLTEFGRTLWNMMQNHPEGEINRTELAERISNIGFDADPALVSAYMNGDRRPQPGFVYHSALALDLDEKARCELTWSYVKFYREKTGTKKKSPDIEAIEQQRAARGNVARSRGN